MTPEELREIWAEPRRVTGQRALESSIAAAASAELAHQFDRSPGLAQLIKKQETQPTAGGGDELERNLKAITSSATAAAAVRKRSGREEPTSDAYLHSWLCYKELT